MAGALLADEADRLFRQGEYREALQSYRAALDIGVDRPDLGRLMEGTEKILLEQLHGDLPREQVLQRTIDSEQLLSGDFTPEEYFVIDQVNGRWTIKDLLRLSPLPEVDALLVLQDLLGRKVLKILES